MSIGLGIVLIAIGAIFVFALDVDVPGVEDFSLGWILMALGLVTVILSMIMSQQRAGTARTSRVEERRYEDPPPPV
jgi:FtsH-binding integral membrane protein